MRKKWAVVISVVLLCALSLGGVFVSFGRAETTSVDWFTDSPSFVKGNDYAARPPDIKVDGCTNANMLVQRGLFTSAYEEKCMTPTAMGLMSQIYSTSGILQPQGGGKAYPLSYVAGGNPIVIPVKNQASGLYFAHGSGLGNYLGLFRQISNHVSLNVNTGGISYSVDGDKQIPDLLFRYADGNAIWFNGNTRSFSENGRYLVVDGAAGFTRINLMNITYQPFSQTLPLINDSSLTTASTAIDNSGKFAAVVYNAPGGWGSKYFKLVDVDSCQDPIPTSSGIASKFNCKTADMWPKLLQAVPTLTSVNNIRFVSDKTVTFDAEYKNSANVTKYAAYSMTAAGQALHLKQYLAIGDSYISGEGAYSYRDGTDTDRNRCHQSLISYPYLLAVNQSSFASVACSGAKIHNITDPQKVSENAHQVYGTVPSKTEEEGSLSNHTPGFVLQKDFVDQDNPEAITISIGGNDIGFGTILERCIHPLKNVGDNIQSHFTCYPSYEDRMEVVNMINSKFTQLRTLYEGLRDDNVGGRRVYVIGYPQIAKVGGDCGLNVQMNAQEVAFAHDLVSYLDGVIKRAADEAGVQYVDTQHAFDDHRLCEAAAGQSAVNGFTLRDKPSGGKDFTSSFHPNQLGHELLATAISSQTSRLTKPMPAPVPKTNQIAVDPNEPVLSGVPKTNRPIKNIVATDNLVDKVADRSSLIQFIASANEYFTKPGSSYTLAVTSGSTSTTIGSFVAGANGDVNVSANVPATTEPGFQTLHLYGNDVFGNPFDLQDVFFVKASPGDSDGDSVADNVDSCPMATQSGVDIDQDGIDDVCDPLISSPPVVTPLPEPSGIIWYNNAILPIEIQATSGP